MPARTPDGRRATSPPSTCTLRKASLASQAWRWSCFAAQVRHTSISANRARPAVNAARSGASRPPRDSKAPGVREIAGHAPALPVIGDSSPPYQRTRFTQENGVDESALTSDIPAPSTGSVAAGTARTTHNGSRRHRHGRRSDGIRSPNRRRGHARRTESRGLPIAETVVALAAIARALAHQRKLTPIGVNPIPGARRHGSGGDVREADIEASVRAWRFHQS